MAPTLKQNSERKRAKPKAKTQTRFVAAQNGTNLATTSQHNANRVNLPKQFTPYVAPHSRTPAVSHFNGSDGGLRTYSYVGLPLHFGIKPLIQTKRPNHRMLKTIRILPTATKLYQTQPQNKPELDKKSTLPHISYRQFML